MGGEECGWWRRGRRWVEVAALGGGSGGGAFHGWETEGDSGGAAGCLDLDRGEGGRALDLAGGERGRERQSVGILSEGRGGREE